jgi:replicative DNA helicase
MSDAPASAGERIPPNNLEAEMALLGSIMTDATLLEGVATIMRPSYFHNPLHKMIYKAMLALYERKDPHCDKVAVAEELRRLGLYDTTGGAAYLTQLMDMVGSIASTEYYAREVREAAALRALIHVGNATAADAYDSIGEVPLAIDRAERRIRELRERFDGGAMRPYALGEVAKERQRRSLERPTFYNSTPWPSFTRRVRFGPGLHGWSAAGKMGKTHAALQNALWDAKYHGHVLYFAAEGGRENMHELLVEMISGVRIEMLGGLAVLGPAERARVLAATEMLTTAFPRLWLYGTGDEPISSGQVVVEAKRQSQRLAAQGERLGSVWVDVAADLADVRGEENAKRDDSITHQRKKNAFRRLRDAGISLRVPFHVIDHQTTKVGDNRPSRNTVRDGGDLHLIAENLTLIWRPDRDRDERDGVFILDASRRGFEGSVDMRYERGLWLDNECSPAQTRSFVEMMLDDALAADAPDNGLLEYAAQTLQFEPARRTMTIDAAGRTVPYVARDEDLDAAALWPAP